MQENFRMTSLKCSQYSSEEDAIQPIPYLHPTRFEISEAMFGMEFDQAGMMMGFEIDLKAFSNRHEREGSSLIFLKAFFKAFCHNGL